MEPMALGSPVGSPAQTPGSPGTNSAYLPSFLLGDVHSNTRVSNDSSRLLNTGGSGMTSPVSHYGTPEFRTNRQKSMFGNVTSPSEGQIGTEGHAGGPPTRGLFDTLEITQQIGSPTPLNNQSIISNQSRLLGNNVGSNSFFLDTSTNATSPESQGLSQWVTVFGFPPSAINAVFSHISSRVRVVDKHAPPHTQSNWIHIKCASEQEAQRALSCNGNIVTGSIMIGVIPCTDEGVLLVSDKENHSKLNGSMRLFPSPGRIHQGQSDSIVPRTPIRLQNARPLASGYNQHLSPQSVKSPENIPQRSTGLVSKAMEYVFGW
ncbi:nucleoporin Nup35 [Cephus cinctus]|uniref:Nucleoporin NUP53 n=1 Tax=Cephus cinctus TaxID=211228 RepID=A0AAJ7BJL8_CEPCN|nr:nucleoporin Nup35 [Cephus cinctus]XP_015586918.1 nucleoporin Nup35 [Cephus cinctus]XP_015586919.1 nucleoporin Nup35 [Cephus cinctus]XP_024936734.1 nucleoporin Nup35 [Cephus cinctus]